ncbi:hypothetical protein ALQ78_101084 [Pseudomonas syringae pv. aptata]|nr:hypothetical protein ALQ78_101084 [Pseudomonas syringae pv. aptata]
MNLAQRCVLVIWHGKSPGVPHTPLRERVQSSLTFRFSLSMG